MIFDRRQEFNIIHKILDEISFEDLRLLVTEGADFIGSIISRMCHAIRSLIFKMWAAHVRLNCHSCQTFRQENILNDLWGTKPTIKKDQLKNKLLFGKKKIKLELI